MGHHDVLNKRKAWDEDSEARKLIIPKSHSAVQNEGRVVDCEGDGESKQATNCHFLSLLVRILLIIWNSAFRRRLCWLRVIIWFLHKRWIWWLRWRVIRRLPRVLGGADLLVLLPSFLFVQPRHRNLALESTRSLNICGRLCIFLPCCHKSVYVEYFIHCAYTRL